MIVFLLWMILLALLWPAGLAIAVGALIYFAIRFGFWVVVLMIKAGILAVLGGAMVGESLQKRHRCHDHRRAIVSEAADRKNWEDFKHRTHAASRDFRLTTSAFSVSTASVLRPHPRDGTNGGGGMYYKVYGVE